MNELIAELVALLEQIICDYHGLISVSETERTAVVHSDWTGIQQAVRQKEALIADLKSREHQRRKLLEAIAPGFGCRPEELTLDRLAREVQEPLSGGLFRCRRKLTLLAAQMGRVQRQNAALLQRCLALVRNALAVMRHPAGGGQTYQCSGRLHNGASTGNILQNEI